MFGGVAMFGVATIVFGYSTSFMLSLFVGPEERHAGES